MNFQTSKRIMCCLMAALILTCAVVRPVEAGATAIAAPVIAGVAAPEVIAAILAAVGVTYYASETIDFETLVDEIADAIPAEYIIKTSENNVDYIGIVNYDDLTYVSQELTNWVNNYLYAPATQVIGNLASSFRGNANYIKGHKGHLVATPGAADFFDTVTRCYMYHTEVDGQTVANFIWSDGIAYNNDGTFSITGPYLGFASSGKYGNNTWIDGLTNVGTAIFDTIEFGAAAFLGYTSTKMKTATFSQNLVLGNTAPDLTDDEEYQSWLERQKFFVIDSGNDGDNDGDEQEDPKKQPYLPLRLLQYILDAGGQSQEDAQSGAEAASPPENVPISGTVSAPSVNPNPEGSPAVPPDVNGSEKPDAVLGWLEVIYKALCNIMLNIIVQIEQLQYLPEKIANAFEYLLGNIQIWIYEQIAAIEAAAVWIGDKIDAITQELIALPTKIEIFFENLGARIETAFQWIWEHLASAFETLGSIITTSFEWIWQHLATAFQNVIDTLNTFWQNLKNWMQTMADYLLNGLRSLLVPDKDYISDKVKSLRNRFAWIDPIMTYFDGFAFDGSEPPIIYIHLDDAEGSYYWGQTIPFLDMRWYSRYKATGDLILSGFLWALFAWRMYLKLPGTISGISGTIGRIGE